MNKIPMMTEACFSLNGVDLVAYIHYIYFQFTNPPDEPDFEIKSISLTFDGAFDSPMIETSDELLYTLIERDEVIEAVYYHINEYEREMDSRAEASLIDWV